MKFSATVTLQYVHEYFLSFSPADYLKMVIRTG